MKKQALNTEKLTLNKFKIASISNFGKSKIIGGDGNGENTGDDNTTTDKPILLTTVQCDIIKKIN